jgi:signal transduction histidine kinase
LNEGEPEVDIAVSSRGSAIDKSDLLHLFEPFFRGKNTEGIPGSGLGLYIVKSIMESLGGSVTVSSSENEGTRFTLHIPAIPAGQEA